MGDAAQDEAMAIFKAEQARLDAKRNAPKEWTPTTVLCLALTGVWIYRAFIKK